MEDAVVRSSRVVIVWAVAMLALTSTGGAEREAASGEPEVYRMSLAEALRRALENNLDLVAARKDPTIAEHRIALAQSKFDGVFGASVRYDDSSRDSTITDNSTGARDPGTADSDQVSASASWQKLLGFGGSYSLTLTGTDRDSSSRQVSQFTGFFSDTAFASRQEGVSLHYEMPLLRGLGREATRLDVLLASGGLEVSTQDLRLAAMRTVKQVEDGYWDLLAAREALRVARESLELAQDLLELNRKKVDVGTLAPIEITQAEAGVASREEGVIVAEVAVENAEDNLRRLLAIPEGDPLWTQAIVPADAPRFERQVVDSGAALAAAMEYRPELAAARRQLRDSELSERVARNQKRHSLTLSADLSPSRSEDDFRLEQITPGGPIRTNTTTDSDGPQWQIGLTYRLPIGNRAARANYAVAALNREKSEVNLRNVEQAIRVDVRTAVRNVESGLKRVEAARANTVLQRKTLEAEQKKFENGMSTSFEVLRIQTDLSNAQLAEIRAVLDYTKALADLERAKGTLLEARGLRLESATGR